MITIHDIRKLMSQLSSTSSGIHPTKKHSYKRNYQHMKLSELRRHHIGPFPHLDSLLTAVDMLRHIGENVQPYKNGPQTKFNWSTITKLGYDFGTNMWTTILSSGPYGHLVPILSTHELRQIISQIKPEEMG